uniref:Uncharacterized protein n=1 Tax=Anguilla anguilla TaxID=7936 RepID=A0A0E9X9K4_ANGAN
MPKLGEWR